MLMAAELVEESRQGFLQLGALSSLVSWPELQDL